MKKIKITAGLLSVAIVFSLFTGITFAENNIGINLDGNLNISETIVIQDGKLISGSSDLIDKGVIILGTPDGVDSGEDFGASVAPFDGEISDTDKEESSFISFEEQGAENVSKPLDTSNRVEIKDNNDYIAPSRPGKIPDLVDTGYGNPPKETVSAVSQSAPLNVTPSTIVNYNTGSYTGSVAGAIVSWTHGTVNGVNTYTVNSNARAWLDLAGQNKAHAQSVYDTYGYYVVQGGTASNGTTYSGDNVCTYVHPKYQTTTMTLPVLHNSYYCITVGGKDSSGKSYNQTLTLNGSTDTSVVETGLQRDKRSNAPSNAESYPMILVEQSGTLNLNGIEAMPLILDGNSSAGATGANASTQPVLVVRGTANLKNVWIRENYLTTGDGAGIYVDGGTLTLENVIIGACEARAGNGGAIYIKSGTVTIKGSKTEIGAGSRRNFIANTVGVTNYNYPNNANNGAGIYAKAGTLNIQGGFVRYNTSKNHGGGICIDTGASLNISGGCQISNNTCSGSGGGVYVIDGNTGTISIKGTSSNKVKISSNKNTSGNGGGLWLGSSSDTLIEIEHFEANSNTASGGAGMMLNRTNKISIKNGTINSNTASGNTGGAIWLGNNGLDAGSPVELTIENVTMKSNKAAVRGGGIYINGGVCTIKSGEISSNTLTATGNSYGGGICAQTNGSNYSATLILGVEGSTTNTPIISSNGGANDGCAWDGGGVYVNNSNLTIHNCKIDGNKGKHGGGVYFYQTVAGKSFVMNNGLISNNYYCGVFVNGSQYNATTFVMNGGSVSTNQIKVDSANHQFGGAGVNLYNASMEMHGGKINGNKNLLDRTTDTTERGDTATTGGGVGAIITATTSVSTFKMTGGEITENTSYGEGAGVYIEEGCKVEISGGKISGNRTTGANKAAAGIYLYNVKGINSDTVSISNVEFKGNISGVRGAAIFSSGTLLSLSSCSFIENKMENYVSGQNGCGGAIYFLYSGGTAASPALSVDGSSFTRNEAKEWGGGLYITGGAYASVRNTSFDGNSAVGFGGGIGVHNGVTVSVSDCVFGNNTAKEGAGLAVIEPETSSNSVSHGIVNNCVVGIINGAAAPNKATTLGGGLYLGSGTLTVTDTTVSNNKAGDFDVDATVGNGGGIYVWKGTLKFYAETKDALISNNTCVVSGAGVCISGSVGADDTAEFVGKNNYKVSIDDNINLTDNGGGIWVGPVKSLLMESFTVCNNDASTHTSNQSGGGIFLNRACDDIVLKNGTVNGNKCRTRGGGIYISDNGGAVTSITVKITNVEVCDNKVTANYSPETNLLTKVDGSGGGICILSTNVNVAKVTITDCVVERNECTAYGGGIFAHQSKVDILSTANDKVSVSGNAASARGGGVYFYNCTGVSANAVSISNAKINDNTCSIDAGGGLCIDSTNVNFTGNNQINGNNGNKYGGGMVVRAEIAGITVTVNINTASGDSGTTTINGNSIVQYDGGGVHVGGRCVLNMKGGTVNNNTNTSQRGGGIDVQGTVNLENTQINGNTTNTSGGGVSVRKGSTLSLKNVEVSENTALGNTTALRNGGGGIYVLETGNVTLTGGSVFGNTATTGNGGGICIMDIGNTSDTPITISGTEIYDNSAITDSPHSGGFKYASTSTVGIGGGVYIYGQNTHVNLTNATVGKQNHPNQATFGGGVALLWGASLKATDVNTDYNKAYKAGGGYYLLSYADYEEDSSKFNTVMTINGGTISNNRATLTKDNGALLDTLKFDDNGTEKDISTEIGGGGIFIRSYSNYKQAQATIENVTIENNYSHHSAGGIFVHEGVAITVKNSDFIGNHGRQFSGGLHFPRGSSTATISGCNFLGNHAGVRGGCMYVNANGISISDSVMQENFVTQLWSGAALGGAIYITSSSDATSAAVELPLNSVDFIGNYVVDTHNTGVSHGGAIFAESGAVTVTVTLSKSNTGDVCKFIGNHATGNGGAIAVNGAKTTVTMNGGYIIGNHAGNASVSVSESPYQKAYTATAGVGGGVAVFGGKFALNLTTQNKGAIYGNLAATAGDDVFANGVSGTKATVPGVSAMTVYSGTLPDNLSVELPTSLSASNWYEDYQTADTNYSKGLNGNSSYIFRYRVTPLSILASATDINNTAYVSVTVGKERNHTGMITITTPETDDPNQRFVYTVTAYPLEGNSYSFTISIAGGETVVINNLSAGTYTVKQQTPWSWRYSCADVTQSGGSSQVINGDEITFYLACSVPEDTVRVSYTNAKTGNLWLGYNSPMAKNTATAGVAFRFDVTADKKWLAV